MLDGLYVENLETEQVIDMWNGTYCSQCGAVRRTALIPHHWATHWQRPSWLGPDNHWQEASVKASLFSALCVQCHHLTDLVVHRGPQGWELVALPQDYGGLSTSHTPTGVGFYLDQAQRAQAVGANSAAVAMYRSALEHLLHDQGYTDGMLGTRIKALKEDSDPPKWRDELNSDYFTVINTLGNAAIHANDGDITQQAAFEHPLLGAVRELFIELLSRIYERPKQDAARLDDLKAVIGAIRR